MSDTTTTDPGFRWPTVWEQASPNVDWTFDCRERRPANVHTDEAKAALADLVELLSKKPGTFWLARAAVRDVHQQFNVSIATAVALLHSCPGSTLVEGGGVWCSVAAAPSWPALKDKIRDALQADRLLTLDEVRTAASTDPASTYAALAALCHDHRAVCIQEGSSGPEFFCRARAGGARADYADLYQARVGQQAA